MVKVRYRLPCKGLPRKLWRVANPKAFKGTISIPGGWNDLKTDQAMELAQMAIHAAHSMVYRLQILKSLAAFPDDIWRRLDRIVVHDLLKEIQWIWKSLPEFREPGMFTLDGKVFYLPLEGLGDMVGIEFSNAEHWLRKLAGEETSEEALDMLLATICRPAKAGLDPTDPDYDGSVREKYNSAISASRAPGFRKLPQGLRELILRWYVSQIEKLQQQFEVIWPNDQGTGNRSALDEMGMIKVLMDLADIGTFGDWEKTSFTSLKTILTYLAQKKIEHLEMQRRKKLNTV